MWKRERLAPGARLLAVAILLASLACWEASPVVQGKVVAMEAANRTISVQDELRPEAPPLVVDIGTAEIGTTPALGDTVRLVYRDAGGRMVALRVMNLTRSAEPGKGT